MDDTTEEFEALFDYHRVQPPNFISIDNDASDSSPTPFSKRPRISDSVAVEKEQQKTKVVSIVDCEEKEEEDWLPLPPKISTDALKLAEDSTLAELRLKKQELVSFAQSAEVVLRAVEESAKREFNVSLQSSVDTDANQPSKPSRERSKIIISIQDKDGHKEFRMFTDDKFERLFKMYADKVKVDIQSLVFCFDGDKVSPAATPVGLGMEDNDIIEAHSKPS